MLRLRAVGLYHGLDFKDHQQEFSAPFEPLPPVEVNEIFIAPDIEKLTQMMTHCMTVQMDETKLTLENASPADIHHLEKN